MFQNLFHDPVGPRGAYAVARRGPVVTKLIDDRLDQGLLDMFRVLEHIFLHAAARQPDADRRFGESGKGDLPFAAYDLIGVVVFEGAETPYAAADYAARELEIGRDDVGRVIAAGLIGGKAGGRFDGRRDSPSDPACGGPRRRKALLRIFPGSGAREGRFLFPWVSGSE